jgi:hypothetical protein
MKRHGIERVRVHTGNLSVHSAMLSCERKPQCVPNRPTHKEKTLAMADLVRESPLNNTVLMLGARLLALRVQVDVAEEFGKRVRA